MTGLILWVAQGFGTGRVPFASGTFGSLAGLGWFFVLLATGNAWLFLIGWLAGTGLSIWLCGEAEKILKQTDPPSVVLDEIAAMPLCFASWVGMVYLREGRWPAPTNFLEARAWLFTLAIFAAFRFFDIVKPWPVRSSQSLPGGWGVTVDDLLAALYVNAGVLVIYGIKALIVAG